MESPSSVIVGTVITGACGKPLFQFVIFRFALGEADPPAVIVNHDSDMIGIVEGHGASIERGIIKVPFRRSELPNEL